MRIEQQEYYECMLATIAALSDRPLAEIRNTGCAKANVRHWSELARKPFLFWETTRYLIRHYKVSGISDALMWSATPGNTKRVTLNGRGSVTLLSPLKREAHIMPFEDGLLYDPTDPNNPFPLDDLKNRYPYWTIHRLTKSRKKRVTKPNTRASY